jgi:hypothetical protein
MTRVPVLLLSLLFALANAAPVPAAAASSVQMTVRAGFDGAAKVGGWLPINIDVRNDGDDVEGEVQILVQDTATNRGTYTPAPTVFTVPATLPRRGRKQLQMEIRLPQTGQRVRARLVQADTILIDQDVQFTRVAGGDLLCGMLSRSGSALEFIPTLDLPPPLRRVRVAHLETTDLPTRPQLLGSLDCLIVDNIPTTSISDAQRDALRTWVANGGLLIVGGGGSWQKTFAGLPQELLPVRVSGTVAVDELTELAIFGGEPFPDGAQYLASQAVVTDGNAVVEQAGVPLVASVRRGLGAVFYLGLDPATEPLRSWPGSSSLWRYMLSHAAMSTSLATTGSTPFVGWGRVPRNALVDISPLSPPSPFPLILALVAFTMVLGPGNYLLLRRLGQPSWALVTIPLITGIAGLFLFGLANANRDSDAVTTEISVIRAMPGAPVSHARTYVGLLSRQQHTYDVHLPDGSLAYGQFYPFPRDPSTEGADWGLKVNTGAAPVVSDLRIPAGSLATFTVDSPFHAPGGIDADLTTDGRTVSGTITNRTGRTLSDASLVLDYSVQRLNGDFNSGETREVSIPLPAAATTGYGPPNSFASLLYPAGIPQKRLSDAARRDVLDSAFGQAFNFTKLEFYGLTLLGWFDGSAIDLDLGASPPSTVGSTLLVSTLNVRIPKGYEGDVPPALVTHRTLGTVVASRQQFGSYDLGNGESVALQFGLPIQSGRFLIEKLNLNVDARLRGPGAAQAPLGDIQFFNWRTSEWEEQPLLQGSNPVPSPMSYISSTGDVRLRYTLKPGPEAQITGIAFSRLDVHATGLMR